ncbi:MAG: cytochrome c [Actinomycetota bacterium]|nr:cytochrome c [Actinomycetota bacterium]
MKLRATALFLLATLPLAAGCGGSGGNASSPGAKVFASAGCSGCHTLKAAGAKGQVGPNLDELKPDASTVEHQVRVGGNGMPSFAKRLTSRQVTLVADFVADSSRSSGKVAPFKPDDKTVAGCERGGGPACFRQAFANIAFRDGPQKALALLGQDDLSVPAVHADCHQISHAVGHGGLAHFKGNPAQALAHGAMTCNSGYYHGVIERAFAGVPREQVTRIARGLCTGHAVTKEEFLLYQCVHGLGHGLMIYSGLDLPWSLRTCDRLQTDFDRVSCTGGVFMQNLMPGMGTTRYLRKKDPLYPCNAVAERHKVYCYLMVTSRILGLDGYDWRKTAAWCRRSEAGWVATCFQSFGRDASGFTQYQPRRTIRLCLEAGKDAGECLYGAARDYGNNYAGGPQAARLCNLAPARYRGYCFEGVGTILGALHRLGPERRAACNAVTPSRYRSDCYRGAAIT